VTLIRVIAIIILVWLAFSFLSDAPKKVGPPLKQTFSWMFQDM
jgi:hypothetical protein